MCCGTISSHYMNECAYPIFIVLSTNEALLSVKQNTPYLNKNILTTHRINHAEKNPTPWRRQYWSHLPDVVNIIGHIYMTSSTSLVTFTGRRQQHCSHLHAVVNNIGHIYMTSSTTLATFHDVVNNIGHSYICKCDLHLAKFGHGKTVKILQTSF